MLHLYREFRHVHGLVESLMFQFATERRSARTETDLLN